MYKNRQNSADLIAILLIRSQGRSWRVAPGPVCGANLICKRERIFEFLNKEISDSEGCLKWKSYGFQQILQKMKSQKCFY